MTTITNQNEVDIITLTVTDVYGKSSSEDVEITITNINQNPLVNPGMNESLNGVDENCNDVIDEGFNETDEDSDRLVDWAEYHVHGTEVNNSDTDGDGLNDGDEIIDWGSDPLTFDNDTDQDGWYWFSDCDDEDPYLNPGIIAVLR